MFQLFIKTGNGYKHLLTEGDGGLILETNNPLEYEFGKSHKTYSITIPNIGDNNILLDNLFYKTYNHTLIYEDVYYKVDDSVYLQGILKIYNFNQFQAEGQFISQYSTLWNELKNTKLNELDLSAYNHILNLDNVINSESLSLFDGSIIYDLIDRGKTREHQQSEEAFGDGTILIYNSVMDINERYPAIQLTTLINNIFSGYTVSGNLFSETWIDDLYMPFVGDNKGLSRDAYDVDFLNQKIKINRTSDIVQSSSSISSGNTYSVTVIPNFNNIIDGNVNIRTSTGKIQIQPFYDGVYNIRYQISGNVTFTNSPLPDNPETEALPVNIIVKLYKEVGGVSTNIMTQSDTFIADTINNFYISLSTGNLECNENDIYYIEVICSGTNQSDSTTIVTLTVDAKSTVNVYSTTEYGYNSTVEINKILPDINISEFLKAFLQDFNIELYVSQETNSVVFNLRSFQENAIDITKYIIDNTLKVELNPDVTNWRFMHKIDSNDKLLSSMYEKDTSVNGDYLFDISVDETEVFESPFSFTIEKPINRWGITNNNAILWSGIELPNHSTKFNIRFLLDNGTQTCNYTLLTPTGSTTRTSFRQLSTQNTNLNYKFNGDLYNYFHKSNINNLTYGYQVEVDLHLPSSVINNFYNLNNNYWLNNFYINTPNIKGYFVLISLTAKENNIYTGRFYYITDIQTLGEFSDDFSSDFNI